MKSLKVVQKRSKGFVLRTFKQKRELRCDISGFTNAGGGLLSLVAVAETLPVLHQTIAVGTGKDGLAKIPRTDLDILSEVDVDADVAAVAPIIRSSQVRALLASAALDWEPLDHRGGCRACGRPLGESWAQPRVHCRRCGAAFCGRRCCIRRRVQPQPVACEREQVLLRILF